MTTTAELSPQRRRYASLRRIVPQQIIDQAVRWRVRLRLLPNYFYDAKRFAFASAMGAAPRTETQYSALVTMAYHQIEKGLSLPSPRHFFGQEPLRKVFVLLERFGGQYPDSEATFAALDALQAYVDWHRQRDLNSPVLEGVVARLRPLQHRYGRADSNGHGAVLHVPHPPAPVEPALREHLFAGRRSIRDFGPEDVPLAMIEEAVRLALNAPSVCNRQGWRLRCLHDRATIDRALRHQNGNRGFGHTVNRLLVVTSTLGSFVYPGERNEAWIDGGLFAMSLMLALHSLGLASCPLNWNHEPATDRAFRREFDVPDDEVVIMFIAVGQYQANYTVCGSPRVPVARVLSYVGVESKLKADA
jgi:nitroreductase